MLEYYTNEMKKVLFLTKAAFLSVMNIPKTFKLEFVLKLDLTSASIDIFVLIVHEETTNIPFV